MRQPVHTYVRIAVAVLSFMVIVFDLIWTFTLMRNLSTLTYAATEGRVVSSEVDSSRARSRGDGPGTATYELKLKYEYMVNGRTYTGDRWRFGGAKSTDSWAYRMASDYPVGSKVTVYHSRIRPATAVLRRGPAGVDLVGALMLTPFNILMVAGWLFSSWLSRKMKGTEPALDPAQRLRDWDKVVSGSWLTPTMAALLALFAGSFLAAILVLSLMDSQPSVLSMLVVWGIVISLSSGAARGVRKKYERQRSMSIDDKRGTITLPVTMGRSAPLTLHRDQIESVEVEPATTPDGPGYAVVVKYQDDQQVALSAPLAQLTEAQDARKLAEALEAWLKIGPDVPEAAGSME